MKGEAAAGEFALRPVAVVSVRGDQLNVHMLGPGASIGHTMQKMPDLLEGRLDRWQARKEKKEKEES